MRCGARVPPDRAILRTQAPTEMDQRLIEQRYRWARAYRGGEVVCGRVELTVSADMRLGLAPRERRCFTVRFLERLDSALRTELAEVVHRRGAVAQRAARMEPVEIVFDDQLLGRQRIIGRVEPPQLRHGDLYEIEFGLWESGP
jgi:hypothetical protein